MGKMTTVMKYDITDANKKTIRNHITEIMGKLCTRKELLSVEEMDFCSRGELIVE